MEIYPNHKLIEVQERAPHSQYSHIYFLTSPNFNLLGNTTTVYRLNLKRGVLSVATPSQHSQANILIFPTFFFTNNISTVYRHKSKRGDNPSKTYEREFEIITIIEIIQITSQERD